MQRTEGGHVIDGHVVTAEVEPAVEEHGTMTSGEDKSVAIEPFRVGRIADEFFAEKDGTNIGGTERQAEVAGGALVDGVHGEATGFIGGLGKQGVVHELTLNGKGPGV